MDEGFSIIEEDNKDDFEEIPGFAVISLRIPMLCSECDDVHFVPVTASALPKEGGVAKLISEIQNRLTKRGWRVPTAVDMKAFAERVRKLMAAEEEMEKAQEEAKARGAVYIPHTPREGGDA